MLIFSVYGQLLSDGVTFICSYMTICFCEQVRLCKAEAHRPKFLSQNGLFIAMSLMTGFGARFAPNLISFNTMTVADADGMELHANLHIPPIIGALFVSVFCSLLGLYVGSWDKLFAKTKNEIVEMFVEDSKKLSFKKIQNISPMKMVFLLSSKSWLHLVVGGMIQGAGAIVLRCLFVYAVHIEDSHFAWHGGIVASAVVLSFAVNILSYWIMFRLTSLYPEQEWLRIIGACVVTGGAIAVGKVMTAAVTLVTYPSLTREHVKPYLSHSQTSMLMIGLVSSICFAFILMIIGFCDLRSWLYQTSSDVRKYEVLVTKLKRECPASVDIITAYLRRHDSQASRLAGDSSHMSHVSSGGSSLIVSPTLKYILAGAFLGRNVVAPRNVSRNRSMNRSVHHSSNRSRNHSSNRAHSDIESRGEDYRSVLPSPGKVVDRSAEMSVRMANKTIESESPEAAAQKAASVGLQTLANGDETQNFQGVMVV